MTFLTRSRAFIASGAAVLAASGGLAVATSASAESVTVPGSSCTASATELNSGGTVAGGVTCSEPATYVTCVQTDVDGTWEPASSSDCWGGTESTPTEITEIGGWGAGTHRVYTIATVDGQQASVVSTSW